MKALRTKYESSPGKIQGQDVGLSDCEKYLGVMIDSSGVSESIWKTIRERAKVAWSKVGEIRRTINHPVMNRYGWLKAGVVLIRSQIVPIMTYSAECWLGMTKQQENHIEMKYRKIMYSILEIAETTKYSAILAETGLPRIVSVIHQLKINFINDVLWNDKARAKTRELLLADFQSTDVKSLVGQADALCERYGLPKVSQVKLDKSLVKDTIKLESEKSGWVDNFNSRLVINRVSLRGHKFYHSFTRLSARAVLFWRVGSLRFRASWMNANEKTAQGVRCVSRLCNENDSLEHALRCKFMRTNVKMKMKAKDVDDDEKMADYLIELNRERRNRFRSPIM